MAPRGARAWRCTACRLLRGGLESLLLQHRITLPFAMTRLQSEWLRLYLAPAPDGAEAAGSTSLVQAQGRVRALVLSLGRPADWSALSRVWQGVQADLALPAPAIAVSGVDAYQLWFSLVEPVPVAEAQAFLAALCTRYLRDVLPARVDLLPASEASAQGGVRHVALWPGQQALPEQWAAFVAPDLAPMFADTPWLDIPPSPDGQADLLATLQSIKAPDWQAALAALQPVPTLARPVPAAASRQAPASGLSPWQFLNDVLNDDTVALALRIEAAKALLPYTQATAP
jgi:hypothetical protein